MVASQRRAEQVRFRTCLNMGITRSRERPGRTMRKQRRKRAKKGESQRITKAVAHIRLAETNPGKLAALDQLAHVFLPLVQQYVMLFCTDEIPDSFRAPCCLLNGNALPFNRQQGLPNPGAVIGPKPLKSTSTHWLSTRSRKPSERSKKV
jgi:hypothetical protein